MKGPGLLRKQGTRLAWLFCLLLFSAAAPVHLAAQGAAAQDEPRGVLKRLEAAFEAGDVRQLLREAGDRVEISIFNESMLYSRAQAMYVMEGFFQEYPPARFTFQEPSSGTGSCFASGEYRYRRSDERLKVYVRLWQREGHWELREIRVDQATQD